MFCLRTQIKPYPSGKTKNRSLEQRPHLQSFSPLLSQGSQFIPQVTDALAPLVYSSYVMVVQFTEETKRISNVSVEKKTELMV